jgi:hypothetical protein
MFWRRGNLLLLPEIKPQCFGCPPSSLVSIPIELSRFLHNLVQRELEWHNGEKSRVVSCVVRLVKMAVG